jgi:hypothetical protein
MKNFLKLIETVKSKGIVGDKNEITSEFGLEKFWQMVEACEVFVFTPSNKETQTSGPDATEEHKNHKMNADGSVDCPECDAIIHPKIYAPFKVFSYEILNGNITSPKDDQVEFPIFTKCVMVYEVEPATKYHYFSLVDHPDGLNVISSNAFGFITQQMFKRIEAAGDREGEEKVREKIKIGTGKNKRFHTIRKIIHVCPKKSVATYDGTIYGGKVDFSHRFSVRGHWRSLPEKLGKDRDGNYSVHGWTWVSDYIKGPEDKPLIRKTRIVEDAKNKIDKPLMDIEV